MSSRRSATRRSAPTTPMEPLPFLRSMGCVDDNYKTVKTGRCKGFKAPRATRSATTRIRCTRAGQREPRTRPGAVRRPAAPVHGDRQAARAQAAARQQEHPPDRVRLRDQPARQGERHLACRSRRGTCSRPPHGVGEQAGARPVLLPVGRRAGASTSAAAPSATRAGRPAAVQQRQAQARPLGDARAVRHRRRRQAQVGLRCGARSARTPARSIVVRRPKGARVRRGRTPSPPRRRRLDPPADDPDRGAVPLPLDAAPSLHGADSSRASRASSTRRRKRRADKARGVRPL